MKASRLLSLVLLCSSCSFPSQAQTIFDRVENWLLQHELQISYGVQLSYFQRTNLYFVQPKFDRDVLYQYIEPMEENQLDFLLKGEFGVPEYRVNIGIDLSPKYSLDLTITHVNYIADVNRVYNKIGIWDGEYVAERRLFSEDFSKLTHSNGINIWDIGIRRNFLLTATKNDRLRLHLGIAPHVGLLSTATQAKVVNPNGFRENYDPGNSPGGLNLSLESTLRLQISQHWEVISNFNYFQMFIYRAKVEKDAYVKHKLRGSNYGLSVGYRF